MTVSFASAGAIVSSASAATLTASLPTANKGDAYWILLAIGNNATVSAPSGWSKIVQSNPSASFTVAVFQRTATAANPVFSWTGAAACAVQAIRYVGETQSAAFGAHDSPSTGTTNPHTSASFTSTANNSLAVAFDVQFSATAQATTPAGWTGDLSNGDATSGIAFAEWSLQLGPNGTASGAISQAETAVAWFQMQFEIQEDPLPGQICL
jgi:hypothetical protein